LRSCVASALSQTVDSFEVIVSDNASDDETIEVLGEFDDDRLIVVRQPENIGAIGNWNACLAAANGTYVTMLSDDDSVAPFFLERCNTLITDDVDLPLIVTLGDVFDGPTGLTRPATASRVLRSGVWQGTEILKEFLRGNISPQMCTLAIKTEALRARGGFPAGWPHTGDLASWVPLLLHGKAGFVNESCGTYQSHSETQTARFPLRTRLEDFDRLASAILEEAQEYVRDPLVLGEIRNLVRNYTAMNFIGHMAMERSRGASRREIASAAWSWRRRLSGANIAGLLRLLPRPVALFVLPVPAIRLVRRAKRLLNVP
jgi:glycosyltransferase involved in cell wall biosynthesis